MARLSAAAEVRLLEASEQQLMEELAQYRKAMKNLQQMIRRESQSVNDTKTCIWWPHWCTLLAGPLTWQFFI
jgi:hypothetical protein